jgi:protein O-GlcNAc transferase
MKNNEELQSALQKYQAGNLRETEEICKQILVHDPDDADVLHLLGTVSLQRGDYDSAITYFEKLLRINPDDADAYYDMGLALEEKAEYDEAIVNYRKALSLNPDYADAYNNLGNIFHDKGLIGEAVDSYGNALRIDPYQAYTYNNLGLALQDKGDMDEAILNYRRAVDLDPGLADAYYNLGLAFEAKGLPEEAVEHYKKFIELNPDVAEVYFRAGNLLRGLFRLDEALENYRRGLEIRPDYAEAYLNAGDIMDYHGRKAEASEAYDKALALDHAMFRALFAKCMSRLLVIYPDDSSIETSRRFYVDELARLRDTVPLEAERDRAEAADAVGSHQPFLLAYQDHNDKGPQAIYGELVGKIMAARYPQWSTCPVPHSALAGTLRIGIVSGYFYRHSNWKIPIKGWIQNIDKTKFTLYGYYTGRKEDEETGTARRSFSRFVDNAGSFEELCGTIRDDNLHMLIFPEIGMDPLTVRLASLKLAPIQCASWGHPDTSGLPTIDYYLSSDLMEPPDAEDHYTEKLVRLPNLSIYYTPPETPRAEANRETFGLRPRSVLYLCCQSLSKYLPQYDKVLPLIARQVEDSQFLFISDISGYVTDLFYRRIRQSFDSSGLNADDHVVLLPRLGPGRYNALNRISDIYLDSIGWSGCNSALEAIACNLPIVTVPGTFMRGRHSYAILTMMGVAETIASSIEEFVSIAVKLAQDHQWRKLISAKVALNKHRVYRDRSCIEALEGFFSKVIKERLNQVG